MKIEYPKTDLVILAGGQARRMNGMNKLLQKFDDDIQLVKIFQHFKQHVEQVWINSHRDHHIYEDLVPEINLFEDEEDGFHGPLMGMKSAWSHVQSDYVLFIPCDVTFIPPQVFMQLHEVLQQTPLAEVAYVKFNDIALYPFCLVKRSALPTICTHLEQNQCSLKCCFADLHAQEALFENDALFFHSINSLDELQQYRQLKFL